MRKILFLLVILLASVACYLPSTAAPEPTPAPSPIPSPIPAGTPAPACLVVTASQTLHLRSGPSMATTALDWLPRGMQLEGIELEGGWWSVNAGVESGYVHSGYVEACNALQPRTNAKRH
jgi:hypothetical protein